MTTTAMSTLGTESSDDAVDLSIDGHSMTVDDVVRVACRPGEVRLSLAADAERRMQRSDDLKRALIDTGVPIYGVTSGFGDSNTRQIGAARSGTLQRNLIRFLSCGTGIHANADVARATMIVRANCLARGHSGVRPEIVTTLLDCLDHDILPLIPEQGSVGASGDLVPLSYVAALITGEGDVLHAGVQRPAREALADCGITPLVLVAKEGLGLVNGTSFMSAFASLALHDATELVYAAELCTALTSSVLLGNPDHFTAFLFEQKPHRGTLDSAEQIAELIGDSGLVRTGITGLSADGFRQLEEPIQDRYSIRCAPHVIGVLRDTISWAREWLDIEINSSNDNPLFDAETGLVRNGGNFYGGHVGQAMDALKTAAASVADLLDRQLELVVDEKFNNGLTPNLIPSFEPGDPEEGLHHGFKGMQIAASSLTAEALKNTMPATSFSRSTEAHNQDKVSMGTIAARDARTVVELSGRVAAIHLLALTQAADLRGPACLGQALEAARRTVRSQSLTVDGDRPLASDIERIADLIRSGGLRG